MGRLKKNRRLRKIRLDTMETVQATKDANLVWDQKHLQEKILEWLEKHTKDIPEWAAIGGMTVLVHTVIFQAQELLKRANQIANGIRTLGFAPIQGIIQAKLGDVSLGPLITILSNLAAGSGQVYSGITGVQPVTEADSNIINDVWIWVLSFVIAYIVVKYGGQLIGLLGDTVKGMTGLVGFLLL